MAKWEQPPREQYLRVIEYIQQRFPDTPHNVAIDAEKRITLIEMPTLTDTEMASLVADLQTAFAGAF